ncbi:MAG: tol-pal system protein YbgF [Sulfitobacter sp.]
MARFAALVALILMVSPIGAVAQDTQTLADIRQELNVLYVEVQRLKREFSTTGAPAVDTAGGSVLDRMNAIEAQMQRLTSKIEELEFRIGRIVEDGTNRIGDLEFRLVELEGGDVSTLGTTTTLGGADQPTSPSTTAVEDPATSTELAVGEAADFDRAKEALTAGDFAAAAERFAAFSQTYPGGPLSVEADLLRGDALEGAGDNREAARAYLASFSADPNGSLAPQALYKLGKSLGNLGQTQEACVTLGEVSARFPGGTAAQDAQAQMQVIGCS